MDTCIAIRGCSNISWINITTPSASATITAPSLIKTTFQGFTFGLGSKLCCKAMALSKMLQHQHLVPYILAPSIPLYINMGSSMVSNNFGKQKTFSQTWQSNVLCHNKTCLCSNNFLFTRKLKEYFLIIGYKQNEKTYTYININIQQPYFFCHINDNSITNGNIVFLRSRWLKWGAAWLFYTVTY